MEIRKRKIRTCHWLIPSLLSMIAEDKAMRLPLKDPIPFCVGLNLSYSKIQQVYYERLKSLLQLSNIKVMLGDGTLTDSTTFDPNTLFLYFTQLAKSLKEWSSYGVTNSNTDDLHRITYQLSTEIEKFVISVHLGIQYHALRYYRIDRRVLEIQKELHDLATKSNDIRKAMSTVGNDMVLEELGNMGYADLEFEELLEKLLSDKSISSQLEDKANRLVNQYPELKNVEVYQSELLSELNDYVMEVYTIDPVLVDYNKLMQGQEGFVLYMDIETVTNKKSKERQSYVNFTNIHLDSQNRMNLSLAKLADTIDSVQNETH